MARRDDEATNNYDPGAEDAGTSKFGVDPASTQPLGDPANEPDDSDTTLPPRFESRGVIGRGGMGRVLRVFDRSLDREVAIKLIRSARLGDARARLRFLREARAAGTLRHPNIVTVYDIAADGDYLVMELIEGESLASRIRRDGKVGTDEVRRIGTELLAALAAAHGRGIIHRDIKPANILLDGSGTVKLTDFGIASFGDAELTSTGQLMGTPAYMAPEQLRGRRVGVRADVYGVGATLFELATGIRLNSKDDHVADPAKVVVDATGDHALAAAIARAVREKESERTPDVETFAETLAVRAVAPTRRVRAWYLAVGALAIAGGVVAAFAMRGHGDVASTTAAEPRTITVAMLPFAIHVADPRLDFASSGLSHLLGEQLGHVGRLRVLGHFRVRGRLVGPESPAAWLGAARALGAELVVRGEIDPLADRARITLVIERTDGSSLDRFEREAAIDQIPAVVQALAPAVASALSGARQEIPTAPNRAFDVERELQLGVAAFERQDFGAARQRLEAALARDDSLAEAHYYLALLDWWQSIVSTTHLERALAGSLASADKDFLVGLRMLVDMDYPRVVTYFRELARRVPDHRDIQYGLFEALFHGGYPTEAIDAYRRLRELAPGLYVGAEHAMVYYATRGDAAGLDWVREHWELPADERATWAARIEMAKQAYPDAVRTLERAAEDEPQPRDAIERELVAAYAVSGQLELARAANARIADTRGYRALADYGLAIAAGEDARGARMHARQAVSYGIAGYKPWEGWLDLVALDLADGTATVLREDLGGQTAKGKRLTTDIGVLILDAALHDTTAVAAATTSHFPQEAAVARALAAEAAPDLPAAATAWRAAAELDGDGRIRLLAWYALARDLRGQDPAAVVAACDQVITPRVFTWAWAGEVGPCLRWSAEAATALGHRDDARQRWRKLIALRSSAPADDELVRAARAALAK
jgi:TolB-like protein